MKPIGTPGLNRMVNSVNQVDNSGFSTHLNGVQVLLIQFCNRGAAHSRTMEPRVLLCTSREQDDSFRQIDVAGVLWTKEYSADVNRQTLSRIEKQLL